MTAVDLVYNPVSGSFSQAHCNALRDALEGEGFAVTMMPTTAAGAQLSGKAELVCVHGGDGTLRDTVQALGEDAGSVALAVAPSGTINLVARELGYELVGDRLELYGMPVESDGSDVESDEP